MFALLRSRWFSTGSGQGRRFFTFRKPLPEPIFLDCGRPRDGELELILPSQDWSEAVMASARHTLTLREAPELAKLSRSQLADFLSLCPLGRQSGADSVGGAPAYHFWMRNTARPDLPIAGGINLRIGRGPELELYYGHVGYHVYPPHRGHHLAERAVRLLLPLAARHGLNPLWITCNPDNGASVRTCQRLGAQLVETITVPRNHPLYARGEVAKCRFRIDHAADVHSRWPS
jgi:predicted acetyltransferase